MKLAQFNDLCQREWMQEPRGDVGTLSLTDDSWRELYADVIMEGAPNVWDPLFRGELLNPVTRSVVQVKGGAASDAAGISYGPHVPSRMVTLP